MNEQDLLQREKEILDEIIQYYMARHEAISARTLAKISRLSLSPTTIRNLMEDLSAAGLLTNEGVTRGRIPTQKAFTIYVRRLASRPQAPELPPPRIEALEEGRPAQLPHALQQMGEFLAETTGLAVLMDLPERDQYPLDWVRFTALPDNQVLVVVHTLFGDLWSKLLVAAEPFPESLLERVAEFICETYRGASLEAVRTDIMAGEPKAILERMPSLGAGFRMLRKAFEWEEIPSRRVWGEENLFGIAEYQDVERLYRLHGVMRDRGFLQRAEQRGRRIDDAVVAIGTELSTPGLEDSALVIFPFGWQGWQATVAVLGPMRMNYRVVYDQTFHVASAMSRFLTETVRESGFRAGAAT